MFYEHAIDDVTRVFGGASEQGKSLNSEEIIRTGTLITRIGRIYTDPRVSASTVTSVDCVHTYASALAYVDVYSAQSVFYRTPPLIDDDKKPQINADKRRFVAINNELVRTETNSGNAKVIFQTGLIGCFLSFNPVIELWVAQWR